MKVIFSQLSHAHLHTHSLKHLGADSCTHVQERGLMVGGTRGKGWTGVNKGLAKIPHSLLSPFPSVSGQNTLFLFMCNIYNFMHMLKPSGPTNYSCLPRVASEDDSEMKTNKAWQAKVMRAMASIKRRNGGAPKLSPAVLFLERLSYFTDLLKTTCLQRQGRKERKKKRKEN